MSHPIVSTVTIIAGNASLLAAAENGFANVPLPLIANALKLDAPRRIVITSSGNDSNINFVITGTSRPEQGSVVQSETVAGSNAGTAVSTQDYATAISVVPTGNTAGTVTVGTNGTASGPWVVWDTFVPNFLVSLQGNVLSGAPTYGVEVTQDDVFGTWLPSGVPYPRAFIYPGFTNQNYSALGSLTVGYRASRLTLTAFGSAQLTQQQLWW